MFKNVLRTFKNRFLQLIGIGLLILMSSYFYTTMTYAIEGIKGPTEEFFDKYKQEEFSIDMYPFLLEDEITYVTNNCSISNYYDLKTLKREDNECFNKLINKRVESFEKINDYSLELREYKDITYNSHTFRFMNDLQNVNLSYIEEGIYPNVGEIALTKIYADKNEIKIGDKIKIQDTEFIVSGFVLFPDYTFPLFGDSFIFDNSMQSLVLVNDEVFKNIDNYNNYGNYLSGFGKGKEINDDIDWIQKVTLTENQLRSGAIYAEIEGGEGMSVGMSLFIATLSIMVIGIVVNRIIQKERNQIGLLKALGYSNREITLPYIFLLSIVSLPMLIIGYFLGVKVAEPFKNIYLEFYLLPSTTITQDIEVIIISVVLPFTFIVFLTYILINFLLRSTPLEMMSPRKIKINRYINYINKFLSKFSIVTRFKYSLVFQSMGKFIVFIIGIFYATILLILSFMTIGTMDRLIYDYYEAVEFEYEGYCKLSGCPTDDDYEYGFMIPSVSLKDEVVTVLGLDPDNELHKLYDNGKDITHKLEDGVIISGTIKLLVGVDVGDTIDLTLNNESIEAEVVDIADVYTGNFVYASRKFLSDKVFEAKLSNLEFVLDIDDSVNFLEIENNNLDIKYNIDQLKEGIIISRNIKSSTGIDIGDSIELNVNDNLIKVKVVDIANENANNIYLSHDYIIEMIMNGYSNKVYSLNTLEKDEFLTVTSKSDILEQSSNMQKFFNVSIILLIVVSAGLGLIILFIIMSLTIEDNYFIISLLKVMGFNKKEVNNLVINSYLVYSIITYLISIPISYGIIKIMEIWMARTYNMIIVFKFNIWYMLIGLIIVIFMYMIGTIDAKRKINSISLQESLKMYQE